MKKNIKGFTLIELLVVISLTVFILSVVVTAFMGVRIKSRDAKRTSEIDSLIKAINLYINETGDAPTNKINGVGECLANIPPGNAGDKLKAQRVIAEVPLDPLWPTLMPTVVVGGVPTNINNGMCYYYFKSSTKNYFLGYYLEGSNKIVVVYDNN